MTFQFTTSHGGRLVFPPVQPNPFVFQFTTSHGGRRVRFWIAEHKRGLSIHDLTRRSTFCDALS